MAAKAPLRFLTAFGEYTALPSDILGQGGSGTVYRAQDEKRQLVAIKVLDPSKATKEKARRFKNEILFGAVARHPRVVRVLDSGSIPMKGGDASFYVMPLYKDTLRSLIAKRVPPPQVIPLFSTLLDGVEAAHLLGVVHRDIKPENVLYDLSERALVVTDFGVAHFEDEERFTMVETRPGTRLANFQYAAPEQRERGGKVDQRADIYALGLILNEMFTGVVPHGTGYQSVIAVAADYAFVDELVATMIRQQPSDRPASIDAVKRELQAAQQQFVIRQKLNELQGTVVPATTIVDPLLDDPIRIVSLEVPGPGAATLKLNRAPSDKWLEVARSVHGYSYPMGHDPKGLLGRTPAVQVRGSEHDLQRIIDSLKELIQMTNRNFPGVLEREAQERQREEQRQLHARIEAERNRLSLRERLTF
ncbi:MAG: serine/threonine protein kinase [Conexibacter sp.]|nr:serine/threonine protein kinase [Conexibacter sp.]